jgi:hypothetical protein
VDIYPETKPWHAEAMSFTAFAGPRRLAHGDALTVAAAVAQAQREGLTHILVFDDETGEQTELDPRTLPPPPKAGRGRPRLGVVAREVTLLPRHWDWLATQPGGASAALRRLVEDARRNATGTDETRRIQLTTYRVMSSLAGDLPGFEDATRALFAGDLDRFAVLTDLWPTDVRDYIRERTAG